jgi:hypothetical protein
VIALDRRVKPAPTKPSRRRRKAETAQRLHAKALALDHDSPAVLKLAPARRGMTYLITDEPAGQNDASTMRHARLSAQFAEGAAWNSRFWGRWR